MSSYGSSFSAPPRDALFSNLVVSNTALVQKNLVSNSSTSDSLQTNSLTVNQSALVNQLSNILSFPNSSSIINPGTVVSINNKNQIQTGFQSTAVLSSPNPVISAGVFQTKMCWLSSNLGLAGFVPNANNVLLYPFSSSSSSSSLIFGTSPLTLPNTNSSLVLTRLVALDSSHVLIAYKQGAGPINAFLALISVSSLSATPVLQTVFQVPNTNFTDLNDFFNLAIISPSVVLVGFKTTGTSVNCLQAALISNSTISMASAGSFPFPDQSSPDTGFGILSVIENNVAKAVIASQPPGSPGLEVNYVYVAQIDLLTNMITYPGRNPLNTLIGAVIEIINPSTAVLSGIDLPSLSQKQQLVLIDSLNNISFGPLGFVGTGGTQTTTRMSSFYSSSLGNNNNLVLFTASLTSTLFVVYTASVSSSSSQLVFSEPVPITNSLLGLETPMSAGFPEIACNPFSLNFVIGLSQTLGLGFLSFPSPLATIEWIAGLNTKPCGILLNNKIILVSGFYETTGLKPGSLYYASSDGTLSSSPSFGSFVVGQALSSSLLFVNLGNFICY